MTERQAHCSCGKLSLTCKGEPLSVSLCHCRACQRRTGSAFGVAAFFDADKVTPTGPSTEYRRTGESGFELVHHFCPDCGATVWWTPLRKHGVVAVSLGAFADPGFPAPGKEVHTESRHPWVACTLG